MPYTVPNQRTIKVHREEIKTDFLGIKNENWQRAARDLGVYSFLIYLYLAANKDGYRLALSPTAIMQATGLRRSTYHDHFNDLITKGYLVESGGGVYDFYEVPHTMTPTIGSNTGGGVINFEDSPSDGEACPPEFQKYTQEDIEINNNISTNITATNIEIEPKANAKEKDWSVFDF